MVTADYLGPLLYHWHGGEPFLEDFRDLAFPRDSQFGGIPLSENGTLNLVDPIGDYEDQDADGFTEPAWLETPDNDFLDPLDRSRSYFAFFNIPVGNQINSFWIQSGHRTNPKAWFLYARGDFNKPQATWEMRDADGDGNRVKAKTDLADGEPHCVVGVTDRPGDLMIVDLDGGSDMTTSSLSGNLIDSVDPDAPIGIGYDATRLENPHQGVLGMVGMAVEWMPPSQRKYLNAVLRDDKKRFDVAVSGASGALTHDQLPYFSNVGVETAPFADAFDVTRIGRHVDGEGVAQGTNHVGPPHTTQRDGTKQLTARVTNPRTNNPATERGFELDYLEGQEDGYLEANFSPATYNKFFLYFVGVRPEISTRDYGCVSIFGSTAEVRLVSGTDTAIKWGIKDDNNNSGGLGNATGVDQTVPFVAAAKFDLIAPRAKIVVDNGTDRYANAETLTTTDPAVGATVDQYWRAREPNRNNPWRGKIFAFGGFAGPEADFTDVRLDEIVEGLKNRFIN